MRLIDAERLDDKLYENDWAGNYPPLDEISDIIADQPTVDPVKHGHWMLQEDRGDEYSDVTCSVCGECLPCVENSSPIFAKDCKTVIGWEYEYIFIDPTPYCPNCGAKMDEEVE